MRIGAGVGCAKHGYVKVGHGKGKEGTVWAYVICPNEELVDST